jgi:hypothetical protein
MPCSDTKPWLALFATCMMTAVLQAQVDTGTIRGTVSDSSGAVVAGAKVEIVNGGTELRQTADSREDGSYIFTPLKIGSYTVSVQQKGFQTARRTGVQVNIQQQMVVNFTLTPGQINETITIEATAPVLQTENGSVGETIDTRKINDLPLSSRNYNFLARLTAGVTHSQPESRGLNSTGWFTANGTRPAQNNFLLDGIDNNSNNVDFLSGAAYVVKPPVDAISEFKLQTNSFSAEFGRAGGAVLNASLKSGTNQLHGALWEFLRNDKLNAADFFQNANNQTRGAFKQNQFGGSAGGPFKRNKAFWFLDYEGTRIRQAVPTSATVPTQAERASGFTDFSDLITLQSGTRTDALGRVFPSGTIFDPSTTRASGSAFVREPFPGNSIPANRLDPNAVKLMNLYPAPTNALLNTNYFINRSYTDGTNAFDVRVDYNFSSRDQVFGRYSFADTNRLRPGPFDGVADGGGFANGTEAVRTQGAALSYTHTFSPTLINELRLGFNREHVNRLQAFGDDTSDIPAKYGIPGVPQVPGNGGLPILSIGGLTGLGEVGGWLVSGRFSNTIQLTENLTKIYGSHTFKGGWEGQLVDFPWIAPPTSRGSFSFGGQYTSIPNQTDGSAGRAQFLLAPTDANGSGGIGANSVSASNFGGIDNRRYYSGLYFQDDWKVHPRLTLNLGVRWDLFSLVGERYGAQANFIPGPDPQLLIPASRKSTPLSPGFLNNLAKDGIKLVYTDQYGSGLGTIQKLNLAPRFGFAYQATSKLVVRGGYGIFYGSFENRGGAPNLGYNYPFQFNFSFPSANVVSPVVYPDGQIATLERGLLSIPMNPALVPGTGLALQGIQFHYKTPYVQGYNFTLQYALMKNSSLEAGYVASLSRHLETFSGANNVTQLLPPSANPQNYIAFPDFARGSSYATTDGNAHYHSLQAKFTHRFRGGLDFLVAYTWAKTLTNAGDLLSGGSVSGFRAPMVSDFGRKKEMALAGFDVRHAFTLSGTYELPFGRGRQFLSGANRIVQSALGGWSTNWILALYSGQPQSIGCPTGTGAGTGCYAFVVSPDLYIGKVDQFYNPAAFVNPPAVKTIGQTDYSPLGGYRTPVTGPPYRKLDFSTFKSFPFGDRYRFEFRAEAFNLTNSPAFANPGSLNFINTVNFARITSTRNSPNDARQIQLALKLYW